MKKAISLLLVLIICLSLFASCAKEGTNTYEISIDYHENEKTVFAEMTVNYINCTPDDLDEICFNTFANAYREKAKLCPVPAEKAISAYLNGKSFGFLNITKVTANGKDVKHEICGKDYNFLKIHLADSLLVGETVTIKMEFAIKLANVAHRLGYSQNSVYLGNFFPVLAVYEKGAFVECPYYSKGDPFYSEVANFNVKINVPSDYLVGSSGKEMSKTSNGNFDCYEFEGKSMRDFAVTFSNNYKTMTGKVDGITVTYLYYADKNPSKSFVTALDALRTFNKLFGKYAYDTLTISETSFMHGGMEYPSHVFIADDLDEKARIEVIAHEIAHEWWYGAVGNNQIDTAYLDEGLAQYSTMLFYENNQSYGVTREDIVKGLNKSMTSFQEIYGLIGQKVNPKIERSLTEFKTDFEYTFITYVYAEVFFEDLRNLIGDDKFVKALKDFYSENKFKIATTESLIQSFERASGKELRSYMENYLSGKVR